MKIFINHVGLINRADIEADGITVIGGYNNSGKSTILKAVYALLYSNYEMKEKISKERKRSLVKLLEYNDILDTLNYSYMDMLKLSDLILKKYYRKEEFSQKEFSNFLKNGTGKTKNQQLL